MVFRASPAAKCPGYTDQVPSRARTGCGLAGGIGEFPAGGRSAQTRIAAGIANCAILASPLIQSRVIRFPLPLVPTVVIRILTLVGGRAHYLQPLSNLYRSQSGQPQSAVSQCLSALPGIIKQSSRLSACSTGDQSPGERGEFIPGTNPIGSPAYRFKTDNARVAELPLLPSVYPRSRTLRAVSAHQRDLVEFEVLRGSTQCPWASSANPMPQRLGSTVDLPCKRLHGCRLGRILVHVR